ncbi:MAG: hypothetical protein LBS03_10120 [Bacteroidales bacterium]|nr:hypothetical protein [Bacteroidales bacterium]
MIPGKNRERALVSFDWALKRLLRDKTNFEVVEGFLSELLARQITIRNVLESESNREHAKGLLKARDILDYSRLSLPEEKADYDYAKNEKSHNLSQIASAKETGRSEVEAKYSKALEEKDRKIEKLKRLLNIK